MTRAANCFYYSIILQYMYIDYLRASHISNKKGYLNEICNEMSPGAFSQIKHDTALYSANLLQ